MDEYISRHEAIRAVQLYYGNYEATRKAIFELPAADVATVRRGLWKPVHESEATGWNPEFAGRDPIYGYICSECGTEAIYDCNDEHVLSAYCPHCGAVMDGAE